MQKTAFLVQVCDADEAAAALAGGADRIGLSAARGSLTAESVTAIVAVVARTCPVSAPQDVFGASHDPAETASALASAGVDAIECDHTPDLIERFAALRRRYPALGGIVRFAPGDATTTLGLYAEGGFHAAFLKASASGARLIETPGIEALSAFVNAAQRRGLAAWIGGALEPPDVPRMLALGPDALAFRSSLCRDGDGGAPLDPARIAMMRDLIPRGVGVEPSGGDGADAHSVRPASPDKVFVRDFVVQAGIGAYRYEHRAPQRMRFNVEADLAPIPDTVADMRDVFSYDVIVDAIRLATRRHVLLVERVALDVAEATLRDARVKRVRVRVEKLDILDGAIGVEIERERG